MAEIHFKLINKHDVVFLKKLTKIVSENRTSTFSPL